MNDTTEVRKLFPVRPSANTLHHRSDVVIPAQAGILMEVIELSEKPTGFPVPRSALHLGCVAVLRFRAAPGMAEFGTAL